MIDRNLLAAKLVELQDRIARAEARCPPTVDELRADREALDIVSFNMMLAVQSCHDIASHLIADEGWSPATTLAGAFLSHRRGVVSDGPATRSRARPG